MIDLRLEVECVVMMLKLMQKSLTESLVTTKSRERGSNFSSSCHQASCTLTIVRVYMVLH